MPPRANVKNLQDEVADLQKKLLESEANRILADTNLAEAQATIQQQATALAEALARANIQGGDNGDEAAQIDRPRPLTRGGRIQIQEAMGLEGQDELYAGIQKYIHTLVPTCGVDWKQDFRRLSPDNLAKLYRAARKEYPILKRYKNDWATAELLKMYLQNARQHARVRGYLPRAGKKAAAGMVQGGRGENDENVPPLEGAASSGSRRRGRGRGRA